MRTYWVIKRAYYDVLIALSYILSKVVYLQCDIIAATGMPKMDIPIN